MYIHMYIYVSYTYIYMYHINIYCIYICIIYSYIYVYHISYHIYYKYHIYIYIHTHIIYNTKHSRGILPPPHSPFFSTPEIQTLNTSPCIICTQPCSSASLVLSHGFPESSEVQVFLRGCGGRSRILPVSICKIYHLISFKKNIPYIFVVLHRL